MKAFITGITGFVGGFLAEHLLAAGDEVLGCSTQGNWPQREGLWRCPPRHIREQVSVLRWDLGEASSLSAADREQIAAFAPDCIYHLAALSVPSHCGEMTPTARALAVNVEGTSRILELAAWLPRRPRVLFTSTSHVYVPATPEAQLSETAPCGPRRGYGMTKLLAEQRIETAVRERRLDVVIARAFQHTGPRQELGMMLPDWAEQLASDEMGPVRVRSLNTWIDLSDVRDIIRAYRLLVERAETGGIYNVGSGAPRRTGDIFNLMIRLANSSRMASELGSSAEKWDPIADISRLHALIGWQPQITLEQTVADTLEHWQTRMSEVGSRESEQR
jgi:GDP-4-dehydro-6-deoxy-D-mannose reductase